MKAHRYLHQEQQLIISKKFTNSRGGDRNSGVFSFKDRNSFKNTQTNDSDKYYQDLEFNFSNDYGQIKKLNTK